MKPTHIDIQDMCRLFEYIPETGLLIRRVTTSPNARSGMIAGTTNRLGYIVIKVNHRLYGAHRIAWSMHHQKQPASVIDHINGVRSDNRIENLRDVSHVVNHQNIQSAQKRNATGALGVVKRKNKYMSYIHSNGKQVYLGLFANKEDARLAHLAAKREMHSGCTI